MIGVGEALNPGFGNQVREYQGAQAADPEFSLVRMCG
jgi:hypothetical protein